MLNDVELRLIFQALSAQADCLDDMVTEYSDAADPVSIAKEAQAMRVLAQKILSLMGVDA